MKDIIDDVKICREQLDNFELFNGIKPTEPNVIAEHNCYLLRLESAKTALDIAEKKRQATFRA